jgi:hypothetical protein
MAMSTDVDTTIKESRKKTYERKVSKIYDRTLWSG